MEESYKIITLADYFNESVRKFADKPSFGFVKGDCITYRELGNKVNELKELFTRNGVEKGGKVAILGASCPNWPATYMAVTTSARIAVPVLPDFTAFEIANILEHSQTRAIVVSKRLLYKLSENIKEKLDLIILLDSFEIIKGCECSEQKQREINDSGLVPEAEDIASIIYTSGTSGTSKGVMLTHLNITTNIQMAFEVYPIDEHDVFLSLLPLSHAYECTVGMLYPLFMGCSVHYLDSAPTPSLLLPALKEVRPTCILSVPLIVEKIYKNKVRPIFTKNWAMQILYSIVPVRRMLHKIAGKKLVELFGGRLRFFGIGGAKLDGMVEHFLKDAGFPYAIGYGMTECSPLLAGAVGKFKFQTTGPKLKWMEMRIFNPDSNGIGEIQVKGPNIMKGYYRDEARTEAAFTRDGWFKTKDLGKLDSNNSLYIKGRVDNMLIGANGENIYPEEIEAVIRENDFVLECLVTQIKGKLVAKVHFNYEQINAIKELKDIEAEIRKNLKERYEQFSEKYEQLSEKYKKLIPEFIDKRVGSFKENRAKAESTDLKEKVLIFNEKLEAVKRDLLAYVNERVNKSSKITVIMEQIVPFEKTATQKIKRYLYA